ncbi:uncharacterized protein LOC119688219 [Teleopsis dalmanni]|uniref:uncharacterized protein LOC119688219 n=1 Tax=Teleopsis dalmanni TaxID=139649 RepID=UPI0018CEE2A7|nr:uncharacterized protein LOC119688219 [Teleopsis dalmanni]
MILILARVRSLTSLEFLKVLQNQLSVVVPGNIDAVQKLTRAMQDRHATYCEIEAGGTLGIIFTCIYEYNILHVNKVCSRLILYHLTESQKDARVVLNWYIQILKKYNRGVSKDVYEYKIVTGDKWIYA